MSFEGAEEEEEEGVMEGGKKLGSLRTRRLGLEGLPGKRERKPVSILGRCGRNWTMKAMAGPFLFCGWEGKRWGGGGEKVRGRMVRLGGVGLSLNDHIKMPAGPCTLRMQTLDMHMKLHLLWVV